LRFDLSYYCKYLRQDLHLLAWVLLWGGLVGSTVAAEPVVNPAPPAASPAPVDPQKVAIIGITAIVNDKPPQQIAVRGETEGKLAIKLEEWLLPFDATLKLLEIQQRELPSTEIELTAPYLLVKINPLQLKSHPQFGRAITIGELQKLPGLKVEFDARSTALKFSYTLPKDLPKPPTVPPQVSLAGLPTVNPPTVDLSAIQQRINLSGSANNELNAQGEFKAVGTILGSSWYLRVDQPKLSNLLTWGLTDTAIVNQNPSADWISGSQTPFWRRQGNPTGTYWGVTTIQRQDFAPPTSLYGGDFVPNERLQSNRLGRTVTGQAQPGTVVRLVKGFSTEVVGQVLVDSSGIFRFEGVQVANGGEFGSNYKLLLYPRGQLTADPQVQEVTFTTVPGQLPAGASAVIASAGVNYNRVPNAFIGDFDKLQGGVGYRRGINESVTVGGGLIYDPMVRGVGEVFWQPTGVPLQASLSAVTGDKWDMVSNVNYQPSQNFNANFNSDKFSSRADVNWKLAPQFTATSRYDSQSGVAVGGNYNFSFLPNSSSSLQGTFDSNAFLRWSASHQQENWQVRLQGNEISLNSEVSYKLPAPAGISQNLVANYQTSSSGFSTTLGQLSWRYQSAILQSDLGYGLSGYGGGINAGLGLRIMPGLQLLGRYQGVSAFTDRQNFSLELQSSLDLQGGAASARVEDLRTRGGIAIQPFFDRNGNGKQDPGEDSYWHSELVLLDKQPLNPSRTNKLTDRVEVKADPGSYRLDLNLTHIPAHWRSQFDSLRVNVALGSYTSVPIPLTPIYAVTGIVSNASGQPVPNTPVIATQISGTGTQRTVTTKADGSYAIEDLAPGSYQISIPGQVNPAIIAIVSSSPVVQQLNLIAPTPTSLNQSMFVSDVQNLTDFW
jgi:Carboxypeptidase regulatory-like domain